MTNQSSSGVRRLDLTPTTLRKLAESECVDPPGVSIYMPTQPRGPEREQGPVRLRNLIRRAEERLEEAGLDRSRLEQLLEPARALADDRSFWTDTDRGLALFVEADGGGRCGILPYTVPESVFVGPHLALRRLVAATSRVDCHLLTLSQEQVRLFRSSTRAIEPVDLGDRLAPLELGEPAETERSLQFHTGTSPAGGAGGRSAIFHGQGGGRDQTDARLRQLMGRIDEALHGLFRSPSPLPLILAGDDHVVAVFRSVTSHPSVVGDAVSGNVDHLDGRALLDRIRPILTGIAAERRAATLARYRHALAHDRATSDLELIVPAAAAGQIELLFVPAPEEGAGAGGDLDPDRADSEAALERSVVDTLRTSGNVVAVPDDEVPEPRLIGAVLRPGADPDSYRELQP